MIQYTAYDQLDKVTYELGLGAVPHQYGFWLSIGMAAVIIVLNTFAVVPRDKLKVDVA